MLASGSWIPRARSACAIPDATSASLISSRSRSSGFTAETAALGLAGMDNAASSELTRSLVGWQPAHPRLIADMEQGRYFAQ